MIGHPMFTGGSQIHEFDSGFKSDRACSDLSRADVQSKLVSTFKYDHVPAANPPDMSFFEPCMQRQGVAVRMISSTAQTY